MKRIGHIFEQVSDFQALYRAARRAARGKGATHSAASFLFHLEGEILDLQREILDGSYKPRPYRTFFISEPKPRTISAADFRDRVAHHALCSALKPLFERSAIFDSYACRPGNGSHLAVRRAQYFTRHFGRFLKLDIRKFFESSDHQVLKTALRRLVKDRRLLELADRIIDHGAPDSTPGKGLPFVKEKLRVPGYVRYMDDFLVFSDLKYFLRDAHQRIGDFVEHDLKLKLKSEVAVHAPVSEGVPFLGMRIWPRLIRLDASNKRRLIRSLRIGAAGLSDGRWTEDDLADSLRSRLGHAEHANTLHLRRSLGKLMDFGSGTLQARTGSSVAAPGTTMPGTSGPLTATTTTRATATPTWGSAS